MPEAPMDKDYSPMLGKNKVGLARQPFVVKEIPEAPCVQAPPNNHFGLGILPPDTGHHPATYFPRNDVSHRQGPNLASRQKEVRVVSSVS
jgi:hypothetical protein